MRPTLPLALAGAALTALAACTSTRTAFDWDLQYDFSALSTWAFDPGEPGGDPNDLMVQRVRGAITTTLTGRGYRMVDADPDFRVAWSVATRDRIRASGWTGYGPPPPGRWTGHTSHQRVEVDQYQEGSLIVDVVDPELNRLVWRGTATRALEGSYAPEKADALVRDAVARIFEGFPPGDR